MNLIELRLTWMERENSIFSSFMRFYVIFEEYWRNWFIVRRSIREHRKWGLEASKQPRRSDLTSDLKFIAQNWSKYQVCLGCFGLSLNCPRWKKELWNARVGSFSAPNTCIGQPLILAHKTPHRLWTTIPEKGRRLRRDSFRPNEAQDLLGWWDHQVSIICPY